MALTDAVRAGARKAAVSRAAADPIRRDSGRCSGGQRPRLDALDDRRRRSAGWTQGDSVTVTATYPYSINILGIVVASGDLHSATTERVE